MIPVAKLVNEYITEDRDHVLIQCMSGAGAVNYASTLNSYRLLYGSMMPHKMLVLDSSPGTAGINPGNIQRWSRALAIGTGGRLSWPLFITKIFWATFIALLSFMKRSLAEKTLARGAIAR